MNIVLATGDRWWALSQGRARAVGRESSELSECRLLWHSASGVSGVHLMEQGTKHAPLLIARQLKNEGAMDGASQVLVHESLRRVGGWSVCYSAVPAEDLRTVQQWAQDHPHVVQLVSLVGLALRACREQRCGLLILDNELVFLGRVHGHPVLASAALFSTSSTDLATSWSALWPRVARQLPAGLSSTDLATDVWPVACLQRREELLQHLQSAVGGLLKLRVDDIEAFEIEADQPNAAGTLLSAHAALIRACGTLPSISPPSTQAAWRADRWFPLAMQVGAAGCVALLCAAAMSYTDTRTARQRTDELARQAAGLKRAVAQVPPVDASIQQAAQAQQDLLRELSTVANRPSVLDIFRDIEQAGRGVVRVFVVKVNLVRGGPEGASSTAVQAPLPRPQSADSYDLMLEIEPSADGQGSSASAYSTFVARLVAAGYSVNQPTASNGGGGSRTVLHLVRPLGVGAGAI